MRPGATQLGRRLRTSVPEARERPTGAFYLIQLAPDTAPQRVKFGWALDPSKCLLAHRCAAPTAQLVRSWPCLLEWEQKVIAASTAERCARVSGEVFDSEDLDELVLRAAEFFATHLTQKTGCLEPKSRHVSQSNRVLRDLRLAIPLTQLELAQRSGLSKTTIVNIEAGRITPHPPTVRKLAAALQVEPRVFIHHLRDQARSATDAA